MKRAMCCLVVIASVQPWLAAAKASEPCCPRGLPRPSFWYHHASTAMEGALRGWADYVSAHGEYAVNRATADYVAQQARQLAIAVEQQRIRARWCIQDQYASRAKPKRLSSAALAKINQSRSPQRLSLKDRLPGAVRWPSALRGEEFAESRKALEDALASRCGNESGSRASSYASATEARDRMLTGLRSRIATMPSMEYLAARKFAESLAYEALFNEANAVVAAE